MSEKKGIFGFFKGWSAVSDEEQQQRSYAISKEKEQGNAIEMQEEIVTEEIETFTIEKCEQILQLSQFAGKVKTKSREGYTLTIEVFDAGDDLGRIIGKNGSALQALQLLLKFFIIRQFSVSVRVVVDAGDYTDRHQSHIKRKAFRAAEEVMSTGDSVSLDPMPASDRKVVHLLFENHKEVKTTSTGEGSSRCVVILKRDDA